MMMMVARLFVPVVAMTGCDGVAILLHLSVSSFGLIIALSDNQMRLTLFCCKLQTTKPCAILNARSNLLFSLSPRN